MLPDSLINSLSMSTAVLVATLTILYGVPCCSPSRCSPRLSSPSASGASRRAGPPIEQNPPALRKSSRDAGWRYRPPDWRLSSKPDRKHLMHEDGTTGLCDEVRRSSAAIAEAARSVRIDAAGLERAVERWRAEGVAGRPQALDPERHYLEGSRGEVAAYLLTLDAINFGSGWF